MKKLLGLLKPFRFLLSGAAQVAVVGALLAVGIAAYNLGALSHGPREAAQDHSAHAGPETGDGEEATIWTCSMHPQIRLPEPGKCPICGMDLIPAQDEARTATRPTTAPAEPKLVGYACAMNCLPPLPQPGKCPICGMDLVAVYDDVEDSTDDSPRRLALSPSAKALAEIETSPVERRWVENDVRMVGFVDHNESRLSYVTAYIGGRLDRMFVDYTGITVNAGDHMVTIYSPELLTAQEELLQAKGALESMRESSLASVRDSSRTALEAARERLRLWGLTAEQIRAIEERGERTDHVTIYAPIGGVVIAKLVQEGAYVMTGERLYTIADLGHLWVKLRAYESDLPWLRYGQDIAFATEAYPGREFHGRISFIDPVLDEMTRTVGVRVNVDNPDGMLKPGMFVRAQAKSRLARGGRVIEPELAGKWISPMHPEIVKDGPGECDVCGMDLVPAEELGFVAAVEETAPVVIPATAPLITGKRAVVYVEVAGAERPTYEGREVSLGPRAGDFYLVADGLEEGERVVTRGAFKIDSSLQIRTRPSMMNPQGGRSATGHEQHGAAAPVDEHGAHSPATRPTAAQPASVPVEFTASLAPLFEAYFATQEALADDDFERGRAGFEQLHRAVDALEAPDEAHGLEDCLSALGELHESVEKGHAAADIATARQAFQPLSNALIRVQEIAGHTGDGAHYLVHCPMAFGFTGADWLQRSPEVRNPYFGDEMLTCGVVRRTFEARAR